MGGRVAKKWEMEGKDIGVVRVISESTGYGEERRRAYGRSQVICE